MIYYLVFVVLLGLSFIEFYRYIEQKKKKQIIFLISMLFIFLSTVRTNAIGDYVAYKVAYNLMINVNVPFWKISYIPFETGYSLFMYLIKKISGEFHFFLFVQACIVIGLQYKVIMYWCDCFSVMEAGRRRSYELTMYFICWGIYTGHIFSIRNILAIMICLYAVRYVHEKKKIKFVLAVLLASTIHISVIIFLAIYIMYWINASFRTKIIGFVLGVALFDKLLEVFVGTVLKIFPAWVQTKVLGYLSANLGDGAGITDMRLIMLKLIKAVANVAVVIVILYFIHKSRKKRPGLPYHRAEYAYATIYLVGAVLQVASSFINLAFSRISTPYIYFQFPIFIVFLKTFDRTRWKNIAYVFLVSYIALRFVVNLSTNGAIPFRTIWTK